MATFDKEPASGQCDPGSLMPVTECTPSRMQPRPPRKRAARCCSTCAVGPSRGGGRAVRSPAVATCRSSVEHGCRRLRATSSAGHLHRGRRGRGDAAFSLLVRGAAAITKGAVLVGDDAARAAVVADFQVVVAARGVPRASARNASGAHAAEPLHTPVRTCDAKKSAMTRQLRLKVAQVAGCGCGEKRERTSEMVSKRADYAGFGARLRRRTTCRS